MSARVVQSFGLAFLFVPINTVAFSFIAKAKTGYATGLINLARNIGGSSGIAICTTLIARREQFHQQRLIENLSPLDAPYQSAISAANANVRHQRSGSRAGRRASARNDLWQHAAASRHAFVQRSLLGFGRRVSRGDPADVPDEEDRAGEGRRGNRIKKRAPVRGALTQSENL